MFRISIPIPCLCSKTYFSASVEILTGASGTLCGDGCHFIDSAEEKFSHIKMCRGTIDIMFIIGLMLVLYQLLVPKICKNHRSYLRQHFAMICETCTDWYIFYKSNVCINNAVQHNVKKIFICCHNCSIRAQVHYQTCKVYEV